MHPVSGAALFISLLSIDAQSPYRSEYCRSVFDHQHRNRQEKMVICGEEAHNLTESDCERGLEWIYCLKIATVNAQRTGHPWIVVRTSVPPFPNLCLVDDFKDVMLVGDEEQCEDSDMLFEKMQTCSIFFEHFGNNYGTMKELEEEERAKVPRPLFTNRLGARDVAALFCSALVLIFVLVLLLLIGTLRNVTQLKKMRDYMISTGSSSIKQKNEIDDEESYDMLRDD
ncbi:hypothetical protein PENTCL1PPCAC_21346 [Pristionchus entomophagus]|uniref:Uncharacterized protein n=1 Tax=Pristionchus entomophagus TaxID=358040 RepID=A0AAV5TY77_9BILA|nr:hypothetical protein PENTCL1PPCAC_21346 [Pristionchus entomophagus]